MVVPRTEEKKHIYHRPRSPNLSDRKRQHKTTEVCVIGAIELIGRSCDTIWTKICKTYKITVRPASATISD